MDQGEKKTWLEEYGDLQVDEETTDALGRYSVVWYPHYTNRYFVQDFNYVRLNAIESIYDRLTDACFRLCNGGNLSESESE